MATRPIVPRANGEGSLGVNTSGAEKYWGDVYANQLNGADAISMADYSAVIMRKPNTVVSAGQIAFSQVLPAGFYLECTTAGTTSSGALSTGGA